MILVEILQTFFVKEDFVVLIWNQDVRTSMVLGKYLGGDIYFWHGAIFLMNYF